MRGLVGLFLGLAGIAVGLWAILAFGNYVTTLMLWPFVRDRRPPTTDALADLANTAATALFIGLPIAGALILTARALLKH